MDKIALQLLNERLLHVIDDKDNNHYFEICEVELYLNSEEHPDPYPHKHPDQKLFGHWHFHRTSNKPDASYRSGTFKGVDITLGTDDSYFGILVRSICPVGTNDVISGPCKVVNKILELTGNESICDLTKNQAWKITEHPHLKLVESDLKIIQDDNSKVYYGPRVGLSKHEVDPGDQWRNMKYRYCKKYKGIKHDKRSLSLLNN
jgi:hypothetical protein